jgi:signal transduction histidine kinase
MTVAALPLIVSVGGRAHHWPSGWTLALSLLAWVALTVRTRWPLPVAAGVVVIDCALIVLAANGHPADGTIPIATMLALYTVSRRSSTPIAWTSAALAAASEFTTALVSLRHQVGQDFLYVNWVAVATVIGRLAQERHERISAAEQRAEQAERTKAEEAHRQVIEERLRIARDLHDMLAHHITVVNAQAGVAQYLLRTNPEAAEKALAGITDNSRAALDDLRVTLGLLRADIDAGLEDRAPAPNLEQLSALIESVTAGGANVTVTSTGTKRSLGGPTELALFRIAQEALTNATKHAPGSTIQIIFDWTDRQVEMTIANSKPPLPLQRNAAGSGHGLIGMHERATAAGGTLDAGLARGNGYVVRAAVPYEAEGRGSSDDHSGAAR